MLQDAFFAERTHVVEQAEVADRERATQEEVALQVQMGTVVLLLVVLWTSQKELIDKETAARLHETDTCEKEHEAIHQLFDGMQAETECQATALMERDAATSSHVLAVHVAHTQTMSRDFAVEAAAGASEEADAAEPPLLGTALIERLAAFTAKNQEQTEHMQASLEETKRKLEDAETRSAQVRDKVDQ
jgi:hypothetical protein